MLLSNDNCHQIQTTTINYNYRTQLAEADNEICAHLEFGVHCV